MYSWLFVSFLVFYCLFWTVCKYHLFLCVQRWLICLNVKIPGIPWYFWIYLGVGCSVSHLKLCLSMACAVRWQSFHCVFWQLVGIHGWALLIFCLSVLHSGLYISYTVCYIDGSFLSLSPTPLSGIIGTLVLMKSFRITMHPIVLPEFFFT